MKKGAKRPPFSEEWKRNLSIAHRGVKRPPFTEEHKRKIGLAQKGHKGNNWKGGISGLNRSIRSLYEYRQWRSDIFTRDCFTCVACGIKNVYLNADHIQPFSHILHKNNILTVEEAINCSELWNINNGRTLCVSCHRKTETWGRNYKLNRISK